MAYLVQTQKSIYGYIVDRQLFAITATPPPPGPQDLAAANKVLKPRRDVVAVDLKTGLLTEAWDRYFDYVENIKLGGPLAPSIPEIHETATVATAQAAITTAAIIQTIEINAESSAAAVEVAQTNNTPGAAVIPPPIIIVPAAPTIRPQPLEAVP
jgi:hypothetical protein